MEDQPKPTSAVLLPAVPTAPTFTAEPGPEEDIQTHILTMVPDSIRRAVAAVPDEVWGMDEDQLRIAIFGQDRPVGVVENRLRISFWHEYERACATIGRSQLDKNSKWPMRISVLIKGVCSNHWFYDTFLTDHYRVAWLFRQPVAYMVAAEDLLDLANRRCREILELPLIDPRTKNPNTRLCDVISRIRNELEIRVQGAVIQKQQNVNLLLEKRLPSGTPAAASLNPAESPESLDERIKNLTGQIERLGLNVANPSPPENYAQHPEPSIEAELVAPEEDAG